MRIERDMDPSTCPEKLLFMIFNMERTRRLMNPACSGAVWLVDLKGFSMSWMAPARTKLGLDLGTNREKPILFELSLISAEYSIVHILQGHYPEFLHTMYVKNAPLAFRCGIRVLIVVFVSDSFFGGRLFWKAMRPFLHKNTQQKIVLLPAGKERSVLISAIAPDQLETDFGGDDKYTFDPVQYAAMLLEEEQARFGDVVSVAAAAARAADPLADEVPALGALGDGI
jgi:hypothetical protein